MLSFLLSLLLRCWGVVEDRRLDVVLPSTTCDGGTQPHLTPPHLTSSPFFSPSLLPSLPTSIYLPIYSSIFISLSHLFNPQDCIYEEYSDYARNFIHLHLPSHPTSTIQLEFLIHPARRADISARPKDTYTSLKQPVSPPSPPLPLSPSHAPPVDRC